MCAGSGEAFNIGRFLEETSPYLWASTGIGLCIGFSVLGAGWCVYHTHNRHHSSHCLSPSQGHLRHWLIHPRRWCQGSPHTDQESHQVCIDTCSFLGTQPAKVSPAYSIIFCEVVAIYGVVRCRPPPSHLSSSALSRNLFFSSLSPRLSGLYTRQSLSPLRRPCCTQRRTTSLVRYPYYPRPSLYMRT